MMNAMRKASIIAIAGVLGLSMHAATAAPWSGNLPGEFRAGVGKSQPSKSRRLTEKFNKASGARPAAEAPKPNRRTTGEAQRPTKPFNEAATAPRSEISTTKTTTNAEKGRKEGGGDPPPTANGPTPPAGARPKFSSPGI